MAKTIYDPKQDARFQHPVIDQDEWRERHVLLLLPACRPV